MKKDILDFKVPSEREREREKKERNRCGMNGSMIECVSESSVLFLLSVTFRFLRERKQTRDSFTCYFVV